MGDVDFGGVKAEPTVLVAPCPKSPPKYPDLCGRQRLQLQVQILDREIGFLEVELQSLEGLQPVSKCCKDVNDFVGTKFDPLVPINKGRYESSCLWNWLSCIKFGKTSCCSPCPSGTCCGCHCTCRICHCCAHSCRCSGDPCSKLCCNCNKCSNFSESVCTKMCYSCKHCCECCSSSCCGSSSCSCGSISNCFYSAVPCFSCSDVCCCRTKCNSLDALCCRPNCNCLGTCGCRPRCCNSILSCFRPCCSLKPSCCTACCVQPCCCEWRVSCCSRTCVPPKLSCPEYSCGCVFSCPHTEASL